MEVVFLPLVGVHVLIRIVKVFAAEGLWLPEAVGGHGEVDVQHHQQQSDANAGHSPAKIEPKSVFFLCFAHNDLQRKGKNRDFEGFQFILE